MADKIIDYKCPACTAPLRMDPQLQKLKCDFCDNTYTIEEIEKIYGVPQQKPDQDIKKKIQKPKSKAAVKADTIEAATAESAGSDASTNWDTSGLNAEWDDSIKDMRVYSCPSCGGEMVCDAPEASFECPYCGNATVVSGQFSGDLRPDYIIPFKLDKSEAKKALKQYYAKKPLLPGTFSSNNTIDQIKGIYVPFWFFDGEAEGTIQYSCSNTTSYTDGDYDVVETAHYRVERGGKVPFRKIPVDASKKMPDDLMDSIEPYDYSALVEFKESYLPGFLASRYDVTPEASFDRAEKRAVQTAEDILGSDVTGYSSKSVSSRNLNVHKGKVHYALLPVYILNTKWNNENYLFAMNGQTGKFIGDLPIDRRKKWLWLVGSALLPSILVTLLRIIL